MTPAPTPLSLREALPPLPEPDHSDTQLPALEQRTGIYRLQDAWENAASDNSGEWVCLRFNTFEAAIAAVRAINGQIDIPQDAAAPPVGPMREPVAQALRDLIRAYVNLLENGRERIMFLGGQCDPVDVMEASDPNLRAARAALAAVPQPSSCK